MFQKLLTVGSSKAVTIPKRVLKELGLENAKEVSTAFDAENKRFIIQAVDGLPNRAQSSTLAATNDVEIVAWTEAFIKKYGAVLESLSQR